MIITAAPYRFINLACAIKGSSPSFNEIEFTTLFPCTTFKPASMISHFELSIIIGTREISGSAAIKFRNFVMAYTPSSNPSSILISMIWAPPSTCSRAISSASSYFSSLINRRNFREPVTLVRSPTFTKTLSGVIIKGSNPDKIKFLLFSATAIFYFICSCRVSKTVLE